MDGRTKANRVDIDDGEGPFAVTVHGGDGQTVLFAAGRGGDPDRHAPLLAALAAAGCLVLAPHLPFLPRPVPDANDLNRRLRRLERTLAALAPSGRPLLGIGHSLGATILVLMAGGRGQTMMGETVVAARTDFARLVLLAPAMDFFRAPRALDGVTAPTAVVAGGQDRVAPPAGLLFLAEALPGGATVDVDAMAGHFSFMDMPPPGMDEPHPDRDGFLRGLRERVCRLAAKPLS